MSVRAFKKGPDYIDTAWLTWASGAPSRNLDTYLMGLERAVSSFSCNAVHGGFNLIEGNRGLFDGVDARGSHSTAELAKALCAPVVLVVNATKVTRTVAALVLGCQTLDPHLWLAGVILNQVSGKRHESVARDAIESACGVPVLGAIPRAGSGTLLPARHLGLVTPTEHPDLEDLSANVLRLIFGRLDLDRLFEFADRAPRLATPRHSETALARDTAPVRVGFIRDSAFTFYYPENLEALTAAGAELIPISSLSAVGLPEELDALYIGGGFPETHARALAANTSLLASIRYAAREGMPVYAECGGLMLLSRGIVWRGDRYPMAGVLPFDVEVCASPQGHGYVDLLVDSPNPFFPQGLRMKGHEFHYSRILPGQAPPPTTCAVLRGSGCWAGRDGVTVGSVWAGYTHLHALATPEWARGFLQAARRFARALA
jgi:cobyrinic acid a,c-diamide synthase